MDAPITLEYPNGRRVHTTVDVKPEPGMTFEMFGRRWQVVGPTPMPGRSLRDRPAALCKFAAG